MKMIIRGVLAVSLALAAAALGAQSTSTPDPVWPSVSTQIRRTYIDNAVLRVQTYHWELDDAARAAPAADARSVDASRRLKELEVLIARMRSAAPGEFEALRATFERARVELDRSLGRAV